MSTAALKHPELYLKDDAVDDRSPVSEHGHIVSEEEYWKNYYEHPYVKYEWVDGKLEEVGVSNFSTYSMLGWLNFLLKLYLETYKAGKIVTHEFGFRLDLGNTVSIRIPDLAVVLNENPTELKGTDRSFKGTYDLCVEAISEFKSDIERDTKDKKIEYETVGVKEYYILDETNKNMFFYRRNQFGFFEQIRPIEGDIICSEALRGFYFRISDLLKQPSLEEIVEDDLYKIFAFPAYEREKQRADWEKQRAEWEKQRADFEKQRADRLAAKLRSLGISMD
jgi:Uma2 family endonuclease